MEWTRFFWKDGSFRFISGGNESCRIYRIEKDFIA
jgi:hypothetical protein